MRRAAPALTGLAGLAEGLKGIPAGRLLIGVSGGADSTALLLAVIRSGRAPARDVCAVHVNHGLRGEESEGDEAFVRALCEGEGVPLTVLRADLQGRRDENSAREARRACFRRAMKETDAGALLLAHNRNDQAETFLMRLLRGSGPEGLACMRERDDRMGFPIVRPLLSFSREEIREALRAEGIAWREDSSNGDESYLRNAVRQTLIPLMLQMAPGAQERIAAAAELLGRDQDYFREATRAALGGRENDPWLAAEALMEQREAIRGRMVRAWWRAQGPRLAERELDSRMTERILRLAEMPRGTVNLPGGWRCVRAGGFLHLISPDPERPKAVPWHEPETACLSLRLRAVPSRGEPGDGRRSQEMPADFLTGCELRTRRAGDRISPFGSGYGRKLQDYLTDRKIPEPWRDRIPLLCRGNEVLLAAGVGAGNIPRWQPGNTNIRLVWEGPMPWMGDTRKM